MYACIKTCSHKHVCTWISCLFLCGKFQVESWALSSVSKLTNDHTCLTIVVQKLVPCHSSGQTGQQLDYGSGEMWRRHQPDDVVFFSCHVLLPPIGAGCVLFVVWNTRCVKQAGERQSFLQTSRSLGLAARCKNNSSDLSARRQLEAVSSQVLWVVN